MRIVMLGWEFPPFIAGGLGTACFGLTRALDRAGHEIVFVLPRPVNDALATHVRLLSPPDLPRTLRQPAGALDPALVGPEFAALAGSLGPVPFPFAHTTLIGVPAGFRSPYPGGGAVAGRARPRIVRQGLFQGEADVELTDDDEVDAVVSAPATTRTTHGFGTTGPGAGYQGDLFADADRYARLVVALLRGQRFDVIHAHDWLTFPAGMALARVTGRPLITHIHSTEFDRSGEHVNQRVYDVERRGMMAAMRIICVSELTKSICTRRYGVSGDRVDVVYNGVDNESHQPLPGSRVSSKDKIVLFLGRITMQKGPEYFIAAAKRVLERVPEAKFIMAGSGDMELRMIELAANLGIGHRVLFTGFLRGPDVDRVYRMADCYVMPSVSEPFGIAPLEAIRNDVPVIISRQSGVSEVLTHCLKVDFWDIDEMANKIIAVLRHPPLGQTMRSHSGFELRRLTWDGAASKCAESYGRALALAGAHERPAHSL
ncbi:MAG: glycosyltransferase [Phycisphaerales bacterium]